MKQVQHKDLCFCRNKRIGGRINGKECLKEFEKNKKLRNHITHHEIFLNRLMAPKDVLDTLEEEIIPTKEEYCYKFKEEFNQ